MGLDKFYFCLEIKRRETTAGVVQAGSTNLLVHISSRAFSSVRLGLKLVLTYENVVHGQL